MVIGLGFFVLPSYIGIDKGLKLKAPASFTILKVEQSWVKSTNKNDKYAYYPVAKIKLQATEKSRIRVLYALHGEAQGSSERFLIEPTPTGIVDLEFKGKVGLATEARYLAYKLGDHAFYTLHIEERVNGGYRKILEEPFYPANYKRKYEFN